MKNLDLKKMFLASVLVLFFSSLGYSQAYTLSGTQTKGSGSMNNAKLDSKAIVLKKAAKVMSVSGDNNGFWIIRNGATIKKYWKPNDGSVKGLVLQPGTYYVYPNLKKNQSKASIVLKLK